MAVSLLLSYARVLNEILKQSANVGGGGCICYTDTHLHIYFLTALLQYALLYLTIKYFLS